MKKRSFSPLSCAASRSSRAQERASAAGGPVYLAKPFDPATLAAIVRALLAPPGHPAG